ncbi:uncharacterized protein LOC125458483 [Stegostoma tigrinum]|uniref:uncharacterized protein LOC125458483 n=1 Tax=Stegostoma tigrinum TaxID=3053191 RepID=UPI00202B7137|nr:uncharacterized protein LOC125458483 [Stegostoma tigrinum]
MLKGLIYFVALLHSSVNIHDGPIRIYFSGGTKGIVLNGSDIPAWGTILWEWTPHLQQLTTKTLVRMQVKGLEWETEQDYRVMQNSKPKFHLRNNSLDLTIENVLEAAGLFTCRQMEPEERILKQYEIFAIKVDRDPHYPFLGSDVSLSCTISRLADTVTLQLKSRAPSQQNRMNNTNQIQLNNTVYLILKDSQVDDAEQYACEIQDNGRIVLSVPIELTFSTSDFGRQYTSYWPIFENNSLNLNCRCKLKYNVSMWILEIYNQIRIKIISTDNKDKGNASTSKIQNRVILRHFDGMSFPLQIFPLQFEDAGTYTCTMDTMEAVKIKLITSQVKAVPSCPLTVGDNVELKCSVSHVCNATRLAWMDNDRKVLVKEKHFNLSGEANSSLSLLIPKIGQHNRSWTCLVFNGTMLKFHITHKLAVNEKYHFAFLNYILILATLVLLPCFIVAVIRCLRMINEPANECQSEHDFGHAISNSESIAEEIHYASVIFQKMRPGHTLNEQSDVQPSEEVRGASDGNEPSVIYSTIVK